MYDRILLPADRYMSRPLIEHDEGVRKYFQEPAITLARPLHNKVFIYPCIASTTRCNGPSYADAYWVSGEPVWEVDIVGLCGPAGRSSRPGRVAYPNTRGRRGVGRRDVERAVLSAEGMGICGAIRKESECGMEIGVLEARCNGGE
jgi:hypothetical protein